MAGIYIHIPFCKQACHYCNFHFSTSLKFTTQMVNSIVQELKKRKNYFSSLPKASQTIHTLYFGGGSPSILRINQLQQIIDAVHRYFSVDDDLEITLEANPDDLTKDYIRQITSLGVNRLSIGIQSFRDDDLKWMNRAHNSQQAIASVQESANQGIEKINIDLIFGAPKSNLKTWEKALKQAIELPIDHISCYGLTVEPQTALANFIKKKQTPPPNEAGMVDQFLFASEFLERHNFSHYEISNYALNNAYSKHNTAYWQQQPYLGVGPAAHSFINNQRSWNVANNQQYLKAIANKTSFSEIEQLEEIDRYNEHILTGLRTKWGVQFSDISNLFGAKYAKYLNSKMQLIEPEFIQKWDKDSIILSKNGWLWSDSILADLFYE